ncbi:MAG: branched-chain amino acid transaminase [Terriglobia bacterium]
MAVDYFEKVWHNGKWIPWGEATIHVSAHVVHYASSLFEGIRCYDTPQGPAIFRLKEHTDRLVNSAKIYRMELPFTREQLAQAMVELVRVNNVKHCYIRPVVFRGEGEMGVNPIKNPIEIYILAWAWGKYLGDEALRNGVDVCVSSWQRIAPNTLPAMAKSAANYMNSQLVKMEALTNGYTEGISLDTNGQVSEGSGENIFVVRDGKIYTPPLSASVLPGITRDSVLTLALEMGYSLSEQNISRELLYIADEVFFTGTAAEITPIRSVDRIVVGKGQPGPVTRALQTRFLAIVQGQAEDKYGWLTLCQQPVAAAH